MRVLIIAALAAAALSAPALADTRALSGFERIRASDQLRVEVIIGDAYSVLVTGSDAHRIATEVDDETLRIRLRNRPWLGGGGPLDAVVRVTLPRLTAIAASRGVTLRAENVQARGFSVAASMGADVRVTGSCETVSVRASMGATVQAENFECRTADVSASMGADARVNAQITVDASASMGGAINVIGNPETRETGTAMGGSITISRR